MVACNGCVLIVLLFVGTSSIKIFVLDEADEMLSRGFKDQIHDVFRTLNTEVQVILLSATMPSDVLEVSTCFMRKPVRILVKKEELTLEGESKGCCPFEMSPQLQSHIDSWHHSCCAAMLVFQVHSYSHTLIDLLIYFPVRYQAVLCQCGERRVEDGYSL